MTPFAWDTGDGEGRFPWWLGGLGALFLALVAYVVASSLHRPSPPTYSPSEPDPAPVGERLVPDTAITLDARSPERWVALDLSRGAVVGDTAGPDWDLAARRFHLIVNGGPGFPGRGGAVDLGSVPFDSVVRAPSDGYRATRRDRTGDPEHPVLRDWYRYDFFSHMLFPRPRTYAVRTADGRYAKLEVLSYYCPGAEPGCLTLRYAYQGDGSRILVPAAPP